MPVVFDASFLVPLLDPRIKSKVEIDVRLSFLLLSLERSRKTIIVPTPALCEVLIGAEDSAPQYLDIINRSSRFKVVPFGERAAVEAAAAHRDALRAGDKKEGTKSWPKVKFDRQKVAIAKVENADVIYSDDDHIKRFAARDNLQVFKLEELPSPPEAPQRKLPLE